MEARPRAAWAGSGSGGTGEARTVRRVHGAERLVLLAVHRAHLDRPLQVLGELLPRPLELLAVAAPGGVELHEPHVLGVVARELALLEGDDGGVPVVDVLLGLRALALLLVVEAAAAAAEVLGEHLEGVAPAGPGGRRLTSGGSTGAMRTRHVCLCSGGAMSRRRARAPAEAPAAEAAEAAPAAPLELLVVAVVLLLLLLLLQAILAILPQAGGRFGGRGAGRSEGESARSALEQRYESWRERRVAC